MAEAEKQPFSYNLKRLAFHLRRKVEDFKPFKSRDTGSPGHRIELGGQETDGFKTTVAFCEDGMTTVVIKLHGSRRVIADNNRLHIETEQGIDGATLDVSPTGGIHFSPLPRSRLVEQHKAAEREKQLPWYARSHEALGEKGMRVVDIPALLLDAPVDTKTGTSEKPVVRFRVQLLAIPDVVEFPVDVYDDPPKNTRRRQQVLAKRLRPNEKVSLTAQFKVDKPTFEKDNTIRPYERRWLRLYSVDRLPL